MSFPTIPSSALLRRLSPPSQRVAMVLDTDTYNEIDDQFALVYALLSPERVDMQAVYAAPFDNNRSRDPHDGMEQSYAEILRVLDRVSDLPITSNPAVCKGAQEWLTVSQLAIESEATRHLISLAEARPEDDPLYVVSIAAITNVATAILLKPEIINKIVVVWLGGHPHTYHHADEFNLGQDIAASRVVLDSGVPLVLMPCFNVAEHLLLTREDVKNRLAGRGRIGTYLASEFVAYADQTDEDSRSIWDMTPIAWLINPNWVETALIPSPVLATSPLQTEPYGTPLLSGRSQPEKHRKAHCTWGVDPRRHLIREAFRLRRDLIFRDFFAKLEQYTGTAPAQMS